MNDYLANLDRALKQLPEIKGSGERFVVPEPKLLTEGKTTVLENFAAIADKLNREQEHLFKFLLRELGTAGKIDGSRAIFQRKLTSGIVTELINAYVKEYVTCSECGRPDTHLMKSERILTLRCDACGAHRPVTKRRATTIAKEEALTEGETYDVKIDAVGSKGDGIAKKDKYTIYVPNTVKGDTVKIKIKKITGTLAFAEKVS
ncbi:MAG: translation initiation factor IF-2 subunit beta [Candidatus Methanoperedens sp.]|nr:translation initiation factor IF-2 subunit beta [Candidatus Methanoperedens sp.]MCZ7380481.1 translation initiation factor IF-2 subunit beta [Candidatus Methanoperedens sp.]MCZ7384127.1 translation initiation factor IF-2 subunit beta [Candidatus Methanoperedens sp.]VVB93994.1 Translation initiation factor 2 subunit beta [uncultured archaeon]